MRLPIACLLTLGAKYVLADHTCLGWGIANPIFGLVCTFKPDIFHTIDDAVSEVVSDVVGDDVVDTVEGVADEVADAVEDTAGKVVDTAAGAVEGVGKAVLSSVEKAVTDLKDLGQFDLTHNPASLVFNYAQTAATQGIAAANAAIKDKLEDFGSVGIGFAKSAANTAVTLLEWTHWQDLAFCLIHQGIDVAREENQGGGGALTINVTAAEGVVTTCFSDKLRKLTTPLVFNITAQDPNEKVGTTIFDIAAFLVPVSGGLKAGEAAATAGAEGVDLAIAGAEDTTRIVKLVDGAEGTGAHFANDEEALAVREKLGSDKDWLGANCKICNTPPPLKAKIKRGLVRRGNAFSMCCPPIADVDEDSELLELIEEHNRQHIETPSIREQYMTDNVVYTSLSDGQAISEETLVPPPEYPLRGLGTSILRNEVLQDLDEFNTAVISWPSEVTAISDSENFFKPLRDIFTKGSEDPRWAKFKIRGKGWTSTRAETTFSDWAADSDPELTPYQNWIRAAEDHLKTVTWETLNVRPESLPLEATTEIFWTPPGTASAATTRANVLNLHIDRGTFSFSAADEPGLVVLNRNAGSYSRITPKPNTWQMLKNSNAIRFTRHNPDGLYPTVHAVFGPEIQAQGRVSMVTTTHKPGLNING